MPVTKVSSKWDSGALVFHDADDYGAGAEILRISQSAVNVGTSTNDVTMTIYGDVDLYGDFDLADEDISVAVGKFIYLDGPTGNDYLTAATDGNVVLNGATTVKLAAGGTTEVEVDSTNVTLATNNLVLTAGNLTVGGTSTLTGAVGVAGQLNADAITNTSSATTGSFVCDGGIGVVKDIFVGGAVAISTTLLVAGTITGNGNAGFGGALTVGGTITGNGAAVIGGTLNVGGTTHFAGNVTTGGALGVGNTLLVNNATTLSSTLGVTGTTTCAAINASGTVTSSNTTAGFIASGAATDGISITGACTDGIDISGACTNAIHITSTGSAFGLLYDVDMTTQIGANVEGVKVILERTADVTVATGTLVAGEFVIKKGDTGQTNKPATNVYGVRIAMDGSCTDANGSVMGLRCETQGDGFVDYLGYFSLNSNGSMNATGGVLCVNAFENANGGILVACSSGATMTVGLNFSDVNSGGTITSLLNIEDGANTTNLLKSTLAEGCIAANTHTIDGHALQHIITVDIGGDTGYIPVLAGVPS